LLELLAAAVVAVVAVAVAVAVSVASAASAPQLNHRVGGMSPLPTRLRVCITIESQSWRQEPSTDSLVACFALFARRRSPMALLKVKVSLLKKTCFGRQTCLHAVR